RAPAALHPFPTRRSSDLGREAADRAAETARQAFEQGVTAEGLPTVALDLASGVNILDAAVAAGFASSRGEARRAIQGGGIKVNEDRKSTRLNSSHLGISY